MIAILFVGLGAHLRGGIMVWRRTTDTVERMQRRRAALDRLGQELASAFMYSSPDQAPPVPPAEFGAQRLVWYSSMASGSARTRLVRFVQYACGPIDDTQGLWRWSQPVPMARHGAPAAAELVLEGCERLSLRYAYLPAPEGQAGSGQLDWRPAWVTADKLPRLIELSVTLNGETLRRVVVVPAGELKVYETPPAS